MTKASFKPPKVLLALEMAHAAGRQQMIGIFRFLGSTLPWDIHIVQPPTELTEATVSRSVDERFDGVITSLPCSDVCARRLAKAAIPVVQLDIAYPHLDKRRSRVILIDDKNIARQAADYLLKMGAFNAYGYLPAPDNPSWSVKRQREFKSALQRHGHELNVFVKRQDRKSLCRWLANLSKPAAIFCANDSCAGQVLEACHVAELDIPAQVSVLGVDDDDYLCGLSQPQLSSVRPDFENEGFLAAQELSRLMAGRTARSKPREIPATGITERASTRQLSPGGTLVKRAIDFIKLNARRNITVSAVVTYLGVSRRLADLRFRQIENRTILETITHYRLEAVKRQLRESPASIASITRSCGFSSEGYLKELFHRHCGVSMRTYRQTSRTT